MTINKRLRRSILKNLGFYITSIVLTAITVMLLIGAFAVSDTMTDCIGDFQARTHVEDARFTVAIPLTDGQMAAYEREFAVTIEENLVAEANAGDGKLRVLSAGDKVDICEIREGREPASDDEAVLSYRFAKSNHIKVGDMFSVRGRDFLVAGLGVRPDYTAAFRELNEPYPDYEDFGICIVSRAGMEKIGASSVYYAVIYQDPSSEEAFRGRLNDEHRVIEYIEKKANARIYTAFSEAEDLKSEFSLYCPVIMIVVVAVVAMVLSRNVKRDYRIIGTLTAMGYVKREFLGHYLWYALIPAIGGDILGLFASVPFSKVFCIFFFNDFDHIPYQITKSWGYTAVALILPVVTYIAAALIVLGRALKTDVIPLLRGGTGGKTNHLLRGSGKGVGFIYNLRSILSYKGRSITLVIGIAVAVMAIVLGGAFEDSYRDLIENKVPGAMLGGQYEYGFFVFQRENPYGGMGIIDVSVAAASDDSRFNLIGADLAGDFLRISTLDGSSVEEDKYYMTSAAAFQYGIKKGDAFTFYNTASLKKSTVVIEGIINNDILSLVITGKENAAGFMELDPRDYNVVISMDKLEIPPELLQKNASLAEYRESVKGLATAASIVLKLLKVLGVIICILTVTMMAGMIVGESENNIAMLSILGYQTAEIRRFVFTSNHILVFLGFILGVPFGYLVNFLMVTGTARGSGLLMSVVFSPVTIGKSLIYLTVSYVLSMALSSLKLRKISPARALNARVY